MKQQNNTTKHMKRIKQIYKTFTTEMYNNKLINKNKNKNRLFGMRHSNNQTAGMLLVSRG